MSAFAPSDPTIARDVRLAANCLDARERRVLESLMRRSEDELYPRDLRLALLGDGDAGEADAILLDARDPKALHGASGQAWLAHKPVIWVHAPGAGGI